MQITGTLYVGFSQFSNIRSILESRLKIVILLHLITVANSGHELQ